MNTSVTRTGGLRRRISVVATIALGAMLLAACGSSDTPQPAAGSNSTGAQGSLKKVTLTLNFLAGGPNSGFMLAKSLNYYKDAGLDVTIHEGQGSGSTASLVAQGNSDFGYSDAPAVMAVRAKGGTLKIIAPILQTNGFAIMSLKEKNISKVSDLKGKTLAVQPGTAQAALLGAILATNSLTEADLKVVNVDPSALVGSLLQKKVDAIAAGADNQGIQLADQGATINSIMYKDSGVPSVGLSIIANDALLTSDPKTVKAFVDASLRGWEAARKDPEAAAKAVADQFPQAGKAPAFVKQLKVDMPLMCAASATTLGTVPASNWTTTYDLLTKYQGLPKTKPIEEYYTNDFLPKSAPAC